MRKEKEPPSAHVVLDEEGKELLASIKRFGTVLDGNLRRKVLAAFMRAEVVVEKEERKPKTMRVYVKVRGKDEYVVNPRLKGKT